MKWYTIIYSELLNVEIRKDVKTTRDVTNWYFYLKSNKKNAFVAKTGCKFSLLIKRGRINARAFSANGRRWFQGHGDKDTKKERNNFLNLFAYTYSMIIVLWWRDKTNYKSTKCLFILTIYQLMLVSHC